MKYHDKRKRVCESFKKNYRIGIVYFSQIWYNRRWSQDPAYMILWHKPLRENAEHSLDGTPWRSIGGKGQVRG